MIELLKNPNTPDEAMPFDKVESQNFEVEIDKAIKTAKENVKKIEEEPSPTFENIIEALELSSFDLDKITTLFFNLYHACTDEEIDKAVGPVSEKLAQYGNDVQLSDKLFAQVKKIYDQKDDLKLNSEQEKLLLETYEGFTRNGALLSTEDKDKLREIDQKMASLSPQYSQNLLKATNAFTLNIEDKSKVEGLPESVLATAEEEAKDKGQKGWTFTLQAPSYIPFMKYTKDRSLREKMWKAYNSRAFTGETSNREICQQIAKLRHQRANLLGYKTHAHFVLEKRMAKNPERVFEFLDELKTPSFRAAKADLDQLRSFMKESEGADFDLMPWDFGFYSEKLKKARYDISDEELRPYFPVDAVIDGVFIHGQRLYSLEFKENKDVPVYHKDVKAYNVTRGDDYIGILYLDLYPRENKKSGAWMTNYREQGFDGTSVKRPHVSICCNFSKPTSTQPSLLTFNEVQTLFHEFGHGLHSLLSDCYYQSISGTNVLWDFVELPSQLMENWTYEKESLDLFAKHYKTGEKIPKDLVEKLNKARNFQSGYGSLRQISFGLVDMNWHTEIEGKDMDPLAIEEQALKDIQLMPKVEGTNFSVGFAHIFAGGYSAGYYSYKWAEVLDADAFEAFKEKGLFDKDVAGRFYSEVLSRGGVKDPSELYRSFRGKDPDTGALLRRSGLS